MRLRLLIAALLPAVLLSTPVVASVDLLAQELLFNGDFSQGEQGWRSSYLDGFATDCDGYSAYPAARLRLNGAGRGWIYSDPIPIEPGATYEASGQARFDAGADQLPQLSLGMAFYDSSDGTGPALAGMFLASLPADATTFTSLTTGPQLAPAAARSARLRVELSAPGPDPVAACVDDLSFRGPPASPTETPTPTVAPASPTPLPTPTLGPTATATEVPMPSGSLLNGGFEEGEGDVPAVWQKFGGSLYRSTASPRSGSFAGAFSSATTSTKWVYQPLTVEGGRSYAFHGFILKNGPPESTILLRISWYASPDASGDSLASADSPESIAGADLAFRHLTTGSVTAPPEARSARARIVFVPSSSDAETIYLDDFALEETPPPTPTPEPTFTETPTPTPQPTPSPASSETASTATAGLYAWLRNGGFEDGEGETPAAWQKFGGLLQRYEAIRRSGSFSGALSSDTPATKWVYQPLVVEPGHCYTFRGFVLNDGPPESAVFLRISWYSTPDASGTSFASSDSPDSLAGGDPSFLPLSAGPAITPPEARSARARIVFAPASSAPEAIYLDDFSFQDCAPSTPVANAAPGGTPILPAEALSPETTELPDRLDTVGPGDRAPRQATATPQDQRRPTYEDSPYAVEISEVLADAGRSSDDAAYEWVELYNAGPQGVELGGWSLVDNVAGDILPPAHLAPGAYAVVVASSEFRRQYSDLRVRPFVLPDGRIGNGLANGGDRLLLLDEAGRPVDALSYGQDREFFDPPAPAVSPGHSLERFPPGQDTDTAADFRDNPHPSPGQGPEAAPTSTATIDLRSEVRGQALSPARGESGSSWPWLLLASALVFAGGSGAGAAGILLWLARSRRR